MAEILHHLKAVKLYKTKALLYWGLTGAGFSHQQCDCNLPKTFQHKSEKHTSCFHHEPHSEFPGLRSKTFFPFLNLSDV